MSILISEPDIGPIYSDSTRRSYVYPLELQCQKPVFCGWKGGLESRPMPVKFLLPNSTTVSITPLWEGACGGMEGGQERGASRVAIESFMCTSERCLGCAVSRVCCSWQQHCFYRIASKNPGAHSRLLGAEKQ